MVTLDEPQRLRVGGLRGSDVSKSSFRAVDASYRRVGRVGAPPSCHWLPDGGTRFGQACLVLPQAFTWCGLDAADTHMAAGAPPLVDPEQLVRSHTAPACNLVERVATKISLQVPLGECWCARSEDEGCGLVAVGQPAVQVGRYVNALLAAAGELTSASTHASGSVQLDPAGVHARSHFGCAWLPR